MPSDPKRQLAAIHILARIVTVTIILAASYTLPAFDKSHLLTQPETRTLSSALLRWDNFHFSHIALNGYDHEHLFAFFPGIPFIARSFATGGLTTARLLGLSTRAAVTQSDVLLGGAAASFTLCNWSSDLYDLTLAVTASPSKAFLTTLLSFLPLSPPTLLFAGYSEPFFATLSYKGMLACQRRQWFKAAVCFMLATAFRSNGIILVGYLIWGLVVEPVVDRLATARKGINTTIISNAVYVGLLSIVVASPFISFQAYGYRRFCTSTDVEPRPWCSSKPFPFIYTFVQDHYWNVGFLRYWTLAQIPNFLFAAPVLSLLFYVSTRHIVTAVALLLKEPTGETKPRWLTTGMLWKTLPYAIHALLLSLILLFASHTQIALRLSSSMPYMYWATADLFSVGDGRWGRAWVYYAGLWGFTSMILWATFLPPA